MTVNTETEYRNGDWVIVCRPGPRFGCSGIINRTVESDSTDLIRYHLGGEWYYADELVAQPGGAPEWPAHDIAALARRCGWAVHTGVFDPPLREITAVPPEAHTTEAWSHTGRTIAAISPMGADGMWRRIHAVWDCGWTWAVETIDPRGVASRSGLGPRQQGTQQDLEQLIAAHTDSSTG